MAASPFRVLSLVPGPPLGGAERLALRLSDLLPSTGCTVKTMTALEAGTNAVKSLQPSKKVALPVALVAVRRAIVAFKPNVIYVHHRWHAAIARAAGWGQVPVVLHCHSRLVAKRWTYWGDRTIAVSPSVADHITRLGARASRTTVVANGVPATRPTTLQVENMRRLIGLPANGAHPVAAYVGRMHIEKGPHVFLQALASCTTPVGVLVGDGPTLSQLKRQALELGLQRRATFPGFVRNPNAVYPLATVTVVPSMFSEGMPLSALESFAAGVPVVASDVPGTTDVVRHDVNGVLVPPNDVPALAAALQSLIKDHPRRARLSRGALDTASRMTEDSMVRGVAEVLRAAAEEPRDPVGPSR